MPHPEVLIREFEHKWVEVWIQDPAYGLIKFADGTALGMEKWVDLLNWLGVKTQHVRVRID